jgi:photosystem II stability/assembly factor-like uncharacterized protein
MQLRNLQTVAFSVVVFAGALAVLGSPQVSASHAVVQFLSRLVSAPQDGNVSAVDSEHIWVGLSATADGGLSWSERAPSPEDADKFLAFPSPAQPAYFVSPTRGWLSGTDAVWTTTDGGLSWSRLLNGHIYALGFLAKHDGWMGAGTRGRVRNYISRDFGRTWSQCGDVWRLTSVAPLNSVYLLDERNGWATVARYDATERPVQSGIAHTDDGGCAWKVLWWNQDRDQNLLGGLQFVDQEFGWLWAAGHGLLRETSDGGLTWSNLPLPTTDFGIRSAHLLDRNHGWLIGYSPGSNGPGLFFTMDGGRLWHEVPQSDLRVNRGEARVLPSDWGDGVLLRSLAVRTEAEHH